MYKQASIHRAVLMMMHRVPDTLMDIGMIMNTVAKITALIITPEP